MLFLEISIGSGITMKNYILFTILLLALFCFPGCGGKKKPSDLPPLYPVKITVIQGGGPLEGATVRLVAERDVRFTTAAITDKNGVATIKTDIDWAGAPAGKYRVTIHKMVAPAQTPIDQTLSFDEQRAQSMANQAARLAGTKSVVDSKFFRPTTSELTLEVVEKTGATETFDVGEAVDDLWDKITGGSSSSSGSSRR